MAKRWGLGGDEQADAFPVRMRRQGLEPAPNVLDNIHAGGESRFDSGVNPSATRRFACFATNPYPFQARSLRSVTYQLAAAVPQVCHTLVVLDGVGRHRSKSLEIPDNVTLLHLLPYSPEPDPVETVFQFLEQGNFANQVFVTAGEVKDRVEEVWNDFARTPDRIASLGKTGQNTDGSTRPARFVVWKIFSCFGITGLSACIRQALLDPVRNRLRYAASIRT